MERKRWGSENFAALGRHSKSCNRDYMIIRRSFPLVLERMQSGLHLFLVFTGKLFRRRFWACLDTHAQVDISSKVALALLVLMLAELVLRLRARKVDAPAVV